MSTQFHWSSKRKKAALALAEGQSQQAVAELTGVCRKTICNWLCVTIMAQVGHVSPQMLKTYSHIRRQALNLAAAALEPSLLQTSTATADTELIN